VKDLAPKNKGERGGEIVALRSKGQLSFAGGRNRSLREKLRVWGHFCPQGVKGSGAVLLQRKLKLNLSVAIYSANKPWGRGYMNLSKIPKILRGWVPHFASRALEPSAVGVISALTRTGFVGLGWKQN